MADIGYTSGYYRELNPLRIPLSLLCAGVAPPEIDVTRMLEVDDVVIAEGFVRAKRKDGTMLNLAMCDVFEMQAGRIRRLTSYIMPTT